MALRGFYIRANAVLPQISLKLNIYFPQIFRSSSSLTVNYGMNSVYLQNETGDDKIHVNLSFNYDAVNVSKNMCFERRMSENIGTFLQRVNSRVQKLCEEKLRSKQKRGKLLDVTVPELNSTILVDDVPLSNEIELKDIMNNSITGNFKLKIYDDLYDVVINPPTISKLELPSQIKIGSPIQPMEIEGKCMEVEKSIFKWHKSKDGMNWIECGEGYCYTPTEEDLDHYVKLKCIPRNQQKIGPSYEVESKIKVADPVEIAEISKRHEYTKNKTNLDEFRIVSYNILANFYLSTKEAKTSLFTYCDPAVLDFDYRMNLLNLELLGYNADIFCLQEVEKKMFRYLKSIFMKDKFLSFFYEKPSQKEGCCLIYNSKKFEVISVNECMFTDVIMNNPIFSDFKEKIITNENLMTRLSNITNVLQVVVLKWLTVPNRILVVGNTHLYSQANADHIRLLQGLVLFRYLQNKVQEMKTQYPSTIISMVICGDFNSTPECGFHKFLNEGAVDGDEIDWKSAETEVIKGLSCEHSLKMKSAYDNQQYTNYTELFKGCLDYIYYQTDHLKLKQVVPLPSEEVLQRQTAIPSEFFSSDHLALVADFKCKS